MHYNKGLDRDEDGIACEKHQPGAASPRG